MNKTFVWLLTALIAVIGVSAFIVVPSFTSELAATSYVASYKYPVFGTATILSIESSVDDDFYSINYELAYTDSNDASSHKEVVGMQVRKPLPEDSVVEELINVHALDYWSSVINKKPNPKISLTGSALIGKVIVIKKPVPVVVKEEEVIEISP